ncbi:MAG: hypothetical protein AB8U91_01170 [Candidatus Midichloria sp.]
MTDSNNQTVIKQYRDGVQVILVLNFDPQLIQKAMLILILN